MENKIYNIIDYHCGGTYKNKQKSVKLILDLFKINKYELTYMSKNTSNIKKILIYAKTEEEALGKLMFEHTLCTWLTVNEIII